jgi:putative transposase
VTVSAKVRSAFVSSAILPPYARRSKSLEVLIPILYLRGISTGDFEDALIALLGKDAGGLSAPVPNRTNTRHIRSR